MNTERLTNIRLECIQLASQYEHDCPECLFEVADQIFNWVIMFELEATPVSENGNGEEHSAN